jgi:predicted dehydrogenase
LNRALRIVHCADADAPVAAAFAKRFGIPAHGSASGLLADPGVEAVYIAAPHHLHHPLLLESIRRGVPALCEKPLALTVEEGLELAEAARAGGLKVGVNHHLRYDAGCFALAEACRAGELGELRLASCRTAFPRGPGYFVRGSWHGSLAQSGGGALFTHGSHALDIALWALGSPPMRAFGTTARIRFRDVEVEDWGAAVVELENGARIELRSSMVEKAEAPVAVDVYGSGASGHYRGFVLSRLRFRGARVRVRRPPVSGAHAFFRSLEGFRRWIQEDVPYLTPLSQSLPVLSALRAVYASAASGKAEAVDARFREFAPAPGGSRP